MKFLIRFSLLITLCFSNSLAFSADKFTVVTTFTVIADMAQNIAGDAAVILCITKPGAEIHNYQPTPRDIIKAQNADLVLWNGLNLELWFEKFFKNLSDVPNVIVTENIKPVGIKKGPYRGKPNPHAWMSPTDAIIYVDNIERALSRHDPKNANIYAKNAQIYKKKITEIILPIKKRLHAVPKEERWLVTSEGAFSYLARDFGLQELFLWPINADSQGTPQQVRNVIDKIREKNIKVIFSESTISSAPAKQVARETNIHYGGILYVDSLSKISGPVPTFLDLLKVTSETIALGLVR
ncbi:MAG: metal ABC transporter substrate-binding protein [Rhodospirillaceae bacterium]|nr:metal ABC transporter substrate-binding protein [Rhodospirillaceae bacterium]MDC0998072.1 metal ABC transporter substrate-binding protein [Alphaproteobacteria bacterium]